MTTESIGFVTGLSTAFCWAMTAIFFSAAGRRIGSPAVNGLRLIMAVVLMAGCIAIGGGTWPWQVPLRAFWLLVLSGVIGLALGDAFLFQAFVVLGPRLSTLIMSAWPGLAAIFAWLLLDEHITPTGIAGIVLTLACISWVANERQRPIKEQTQQRHWGSKGLGVIFAFLGAAGQALGYVVAKQAMTIATDVRPLSATFLRAVAAVVVIWMVAIGSNRWLQWINSARRDTEALRLLTIGAFCGPFLGVWLSLVTAEYIAVGIAATLMASVPLWTLVFDIIRYQRIPSLRAIFGTLGAIVGIVLLVLRGS